MRIPPLRVLAGTLALTAAVLASCARQDVASFTASAKSYLAKGDYKAAIIQIKNALQKDPGSAEARLLMARALIDSGDPVAAETEVRKAIEAHAPPDDAYPVLARALNAQGEYDKTVNELGTRHLDGAKGRADLAVGLAGAYAAQGHLEKARGALDAALQDQPGNVRALLLEAQLAGQAGDLDGVRKYVDLALKQAPDDVEGLLMKSQLALQEHRTADAQKTLDRAIDAHPESIAARAAAASLAVTSGKLDLAKAQVAKMKEIQGRDIRTVYSDALVAFASGDNVHARDATQRLLAARPDHLPSMMLSALADYQLGSLHSAEDKLTRVIARAPTDPTARRVLASIYLRTGRAAQALDTLAPALRKTPDDPTLLRIAGEAYLASGNPMQAASQYERANALDKSNVASEIRLAQVRFAAGETTRAFDELEALSAKDAKAGQADMALFSAHLKRREFDQALAVADTLEKKDPKSAIPWNLRGIVYSVERDLAKARASFEKALALQPDFYAAASSLATLDIQEGKLDAARDRYDRLLAKNPKNEQLLLASAQVLAMSGASPEQVRGAFDKAVQANPSSVAARLAKINFDLRRRDAKSALASAQAAVAAIPNDPQLIDALATTQFMNGNANQGVETLTRLTALQPKNPVAFLRLAEGQRAVKDYTGALASERKALELKPDYSPAWNAIAKTYMAAGKPDAALAEARRVQKEYADKAAGFALEGEILSAERKWPEAAVAYRAALKRQSSPVLAARLYVVLNVAGKRDEAMAAADAWMKDNPKDATLLQLMAQEDQQRKEYGAAIAEYKRVLAIDPDSIAALNNLAWILTEQGNPEAVEYAERAHRLAPLNANVLDTLGYALARTGDAKRGAQLLRMASALAPGQNEIRLHLAKALVDTGDKVGARQALQELAKLDKNSPIRIEAEKLLAKL